MARTSSVLVCMVAAANGLSLSIPPSAQSLHRDTKVEREGADTMVTCFLPNEQFAGKVKWCKSATVSTGKPITAPRRQAYLLATYTPEVADEVSDKFCSDPRAWLNSIAGHRLPPYHEMLAEDASDPVFLEVGGHVGTWAFGMANAGYRSITVEPKSSVRALFNASQCLNEELAHFVKVVPAFLTAKSTNSETCGVCTNTKIGASFVAKVSSASLCPSSEENCRCWTVAEKLGGWIHQSRSDECTHEFDVPKMTLDEVVEKNGKRVDVLKLNFEGYDLKILNGATNVLSQIRPRFIVAELGNGLEGATAIELASTLRSAGYVLKEGNFKGNDIIGQFETGDSPYMHFVRKE